MCNLFDLSTSIIINYDHNSSLSTVITPDSPGSVLVDTNSFTNSSVAISWTASPSVCNTIFTYSVNSTNDTTTSNSTVLEGLVPSNDNYCVTVTAIDYTTRTSEQDTNISGIPSQYETPIKTTVLEMNTNTAYGQIQYNQTNRPPPTTTTTTTSTSTG